MPNWIRKPLAVLFVGSILASFQNYFGVILRITLIFTGIASGALLIFDNIRRKQMDGIEGVVLTHEFPPDLNNINTDIDL